MVYLLAACPGSILSPELNWDWLQGPKKYHQLSKPEALGMAEQRLVDLATRQRRYTRAAEARRTNSVPHSTFKAVIRARM